MERSKYLFTLLILLLSLNTLVKGENQNKIYKAYIEGNMNEWENVIKEIEKEEFSNLLLQLELLNYYYGYIAFLIDSGENKKAKEYLKKGEHIIESIHDKNPNHAVVYAYKGSFTAYRLTLNKLKAITLGPQSMKYINKAYEMDSLNVQIITDKANLLYYAPTVFGGNKEKALALYDKAIQRMEETEQNLQNWFYLNLLTTQAQNKESLGLYEEAEILYNKILLIEPSFTWVKEELYPELLKKKINTNKIILHH